MTKAKIEIVAKPIKGFEWAREFAPHHLYILITMSNGDQTAIRGGPAGGDAANNWLFDDLKVTQFQYNDRHPDWDRKDTHPKHLLAQGDDAYINSMINGANFQKTFDWINNGNFDYKVAIPHLGLLNSMPYLNLLSKIPNLSSQQNSNTVARVCVEAMGLEFVSPGYLVKSKFISALAPGVEQIKIGDTLFDGTRKMGKKLHAQLDNHFQKIYNKYVFDQQQDLLKNYKPQFSKNEIFESNIPISKSHLINEPASLYTKQGQDTYGQSSVSSSQRDSHLGAWTGPMRGEIFYAASHVSPLVLDLNGDGVKLLPYTNGVYFDIDNDGFAERVGWLSAEDGQLARDVNQNGKIDDITELFGDDVISAFLKLSLLDSNHDNIIDDKDEEFKELLIWQDKNLNGYSEPEELKNLKELGIQNISLNTQPDDRVIEGNKITSTSTFSYTDGRQCEVADVHYHNDDMDSWYKGQKSGYKIDEAEYTEEIKEFRQQVLEKLSEKIKNPDSVDKTVDWVADTVKFETNKYVEEYNNQKNEELSKLLNKINEVSNYKNFESKKAFEYEKNDLEKEANQKLNALKKELAAKLLEETKNKTIPIKDNISSRYTKEYIKELDVLKDDINVRLKKAHFETIEISEKEKWTEDQYQKTIAAHKAKFTEEFEIQKAVIKKHYAQLVQDALDGVKGGLQKEYDEKLANLTAALKEKEASKFLKKTHEHNQECEVEGRGINAVLGDQFLKAVEVANQSMADFSSVIKEEANRTYHFFVSQVIPKAVFPEIEADLDIDFDFNFEEPAQKNSTDCHNEFNLGEVTDWLNDQFFISQQNNSKINGDEHNGIKIDPETLQMPLMRGYGKMPSLHIAMTKNGKLKEMVSELTKAEPEEFIEIYDKIADILYEWAGVSNVAEDSRAVAGRISNIGARKVAFIEQITGQEFRQLGVAKFVGQYASTAVQKAWDIAFMRVSQNLLIQGPLKVLFPQAEYSFLDDKINFNSTLDEILVLSQEFAVKHNLDYDFWVQLGYILIQSINELNSSIEEINNRLSQLAGEPIMLDINTFGLIGDDNPNIIRGTSGSDYIKGLGGDDKLYGRGGSDFIEGDDGDDELYGNEGIDRMYGGTGNDKMYGGEGRDFMYGEDGDDEIYGEAGNDHIEGGAGADIMDGGEGVNTLSYGSAPGGVYVNLESNEALDKDLQKSENQTSHASGDQFKNFQNIGGSEYNDHLIGDNHNNYINGESGDDTIEGLGGDDHLFGANGNDQLLGGDGNDILTGFEGPDHMDGGPGIDIANYNHPYARYGVHVDLMTGKGVGGYAHDDTYKDIENVIGSIHDDIIQGNNENNILQGLEGNDIIHGADGDDAIMGGPGEDKLYGGKGDDKILLTGDGDYADGGEGADTVSYEFATEPVVLNMTLGIGRTHVLKEDKFEGFENAQGSQFDDSITGDDKDNTLSGFKGNDLIKGGKGNDILIGGEGDDKLYGEEGNDTIFGGEGKDEIDGGEGIDIVDYSKELNTGIKIDLEKGIVKGGIAQGDKLENIEGVVGTKFDDILIGDKENNFLFGQEGNDDLQGREGDDQLSGGAGNNTLDGGLGIDLASYAWSQEGVDINLAEGKSSKDGIYEDIYIEIEGIIGSSHNDRIIGDDRNNYLYGGDGDDYINGGAWNDKISGGKGNNILEGGKGSDEFLLVEGSNKVDGGDGEDTISYAAYKAENYIDLHTKEFEMRLKNNLIPKTSGELFTKPIVHSTVGLEINLMTAIVEKPGGLVDEFINIENVIGTNFDDTIIGDDNNNYLIGTNGNDKIYGGKGDDKIECGWGPSDLFGEEGNDFFIIKGFPANIDGGEGVDSADFMNLPVSIEANLKDSYVLYNDASKIVKSKLKHIENLRGTNFDDVIYDNDADNIIAGGKGNDRIYLTNGDDVVNGQAGKDIIYLGGGGNKQIWGGGIDSDIFVITKNFQTQNKTSTVIVDFDAGVAEDKIDLRAFSHLKKMEDLNAEQLTHDNKVFATLTIDQEKWISLYNVNISKLHPSNFIFVSDDMETICSQSQSHFDDFVSMSNSSGAVCDMKFLQDFEYY